MPLTRCRNFDDDGKEIRGGCFRRDCEYIHPTDPKWQWARKYDPNSARGRGRGRGGGGKGGGDAHTSWGHPPSVLSKGADLTWESSGQGSTSASTPFTRSAGSGDTGKSDWGNATYEGISTPDTTGSQHDKTDAQGVSGWGNGQGSGWGDSGWSTTGGDNNEMATSGNSGWGDNTSGWGTSQDNGWGTTKDNGWETSDGNGWGSSRDNKGSRKDSQPGNNRDIGWGTKDAGGTALTANSAMTHLDERETTKSVPSSTVTETSHIPLPSRKPSSSHLPLPASSLKKTHPPSSPLKIRTASFADKVENSPTIVSASRETPSRVQVYSNTIRHIQHAVRLQLQLENAQAAVDRWKTTQLSSQYSRASPATRKILDETRAAFNKDTVDITNRLKLAIGALADLPDLSVVSGKTYPDVDENQIMEYTAQLKDWIGKLQLGSRIVLPSPPPENDTLHPQDGQPWTLEHIKESFIELERLAENVAEQIYIKKFTHMMDIMDPNDKIAALLDAHREREASQAALRSGRADALLRKADEVGNNLSERVLLVTQLFIKVQHNEEKLEKLRDEKRQRDEMKSRIEGYFKKFDEWQQEESAQIQQLTDQIINLHSFRHPTPRLLEIEDIRPKLRELVITKLESEVMPVINHFRAACSQNNEHLVKELYKKLKPTLDLTADICRRAREEEALSKTS